MKFSKIGGWGWVVVFASFLCCVVVDGVVMGAGDPLVAALKTEFKSASEFTVICNFMQFLPKSESNNFKSHHHRCHLCNH